MEPEIKIQVDYGSGEKENEESEDQKASEDRSPQRNGSILADGIILHVPSESDISQKSMSPRLEDMHFLSPASAEQGEQYRRHSLNLEESRTSPKERSRKRSCPETELHKSHRRRRHSRSPASHAEGDLLFPPRSPRESGDRLTPSSRRSSCSSGCHSRRSSRADDGEGGSHHHHHHHHHHHRRHSKARRESAYSYGGDAVSQKSRRSSSYVGDSRKSSRVSGVEEIKTEENKEDEEGRPKRKVVIIICSVAFTLLLMSVVLVTVTLFLSPTIDDLARSATTNEAESREDT